MPRTLVLDRPRHLRLSEQASRPLRAGEVRLRALLSGISHGTELSLYRGTSAFVDKVFDRGLRAFVVPPAGSVAAYPVTLGYEMVAEVVEAAPDATEVQVGDLVHTGTPHHEETVRRRSRPPTRWCGCPRPSGWSGRCSSASPRWRCRPSTTPRSSWETR